MSSLTARALNRLRLIGLFEGLSFLVLLFVAMPLKYLAGAPQMVQVVGWIHGLLFILFVTAVADVARRMHWSYDRVAAAIGAALVPFGPFVLDARLRRDLESLALPGAAASP